VTSGISNPRVGIYYKASVTPDTGAIGVYWDDGTINASEIFEDVAADTTEAFLTHDWDGITGEPAYCLLNAMRAILNKKTQSPGYINVLKEDGATVAYQVPITTAVSPAVGVTETGEPAQ